MEQCIYEYPKLYNDEALFYMFGQLIRALLLLNIRFERFPPIVFNRGSTQVYYSSFMRLS